MIIRFGTEIGYKGPRDVLILSENLASTIDNPSIIDEKLEEDLRLCRVVLVPTPLTPFISSPLGLVPKYNGDLRHIHHLSHSKGKLVNDHTSDSIGELRYTRFQEVLNLNLWRRPKIHHHQKRHERRLLKCTSYLSALVAARIQVKKQIIQKNVLIFRTCESAFHFQSFWRKPLLDPSFLSTLEPLLLLGWHHSSVWCKIDTPLATCWGTSLHLSYRPAWYPEKWEEKLS